MQESPYWCHQVFRLVRSPSVFPHGLAEGSSVLRDNLYCFVLRPPYKNDIGGVRPWRSLF